MLARLRHWSRRAVTHLPVLPLIPALPTSCALCGVCEGEALCRHCRHRFTAARGPRCACCGITIVVAAARCGGCLRALPAFDATVTAADYAPPLDQLVLRLKFGARLELAPLLAALLRDVAHEMPPGQMPALLIPVPLGPLRLCERGFNQALEIARPLGRSLGLPVARALAVRTRDTGAQSLLHPDERRSNVAGAFSIQKGASLEGLHIGVVDDVMTTGETLHALATELKHAGATRVTNFVFARTLPA